MTMPFVRRLSTVTVLPLFVFACGGAGSNRAVSRPVPLVEAVPARFGTLPIEETVPGTVRARNQVAIRPEIAGRVVEVMVQSGEAVAPGQALVRLDGTEPRERLRQAEADVRLAEASAEAAAARRAELAARVARTRTLAGEQLVSAQEVETLEAQLAAVRASADEATARVEQARATVEERRSELAKSVVRAPVGGRLGERQVEVGMRVDPSTLLFVVGDLDRLIVEVTLTEEMLAHVEVGQAVSIEPRSSAGEPVRAELVRISPFLSAESFTTRGEIEVDNRAGRLRPGMFVTVRILVGESRHSTLVPVAALWQDPASGEQGIYVVEDAAGLEEPAEPAPRGASRAALESPEESRSVSFRRVELLAEGHGVAGVSGVAEGEWVVTIGQHLLGEELGAGPASDGVPRGAGVRVRPLAWERVRELQALQDEDLLEGFLDKQRKVAAALGASIPESEEVVERLMEEAEAAEQERAAGPEAGSGGG